MNDSNNLSNQRNESAASETTYPPKPVDQPKKNILAKSITSLLLSVGAFYLVFDWSFLFIFLVLLVLIIHELGHFLAMKIYGFKDLSIFFIPLIGAAATGTREQVSQKQSAVIHLAGPIPGIVIGIILFFISRLTNDQVLFKASLLFCILNLFNLVPVLPLDGGRLLKTLFLEKNETISKIFSILSMIVLTVYAIQSKSYALLLFPLLSLVSLKASKEIRVVKEQVLLAGIDSNKTFSTLSDDEYWRIRDIIGENMSYYRRFITPGTHVQDANEQKIVNQIKGLLIPPQTHDLHAFGKLSVILIWALAFILPVAIFLYFRF